MHCAFASVHAQEPTTEPTSQSESKADPAVAAPSPAESATDFTDLLVPAPPSAVTSDEPHEKDANTSEASQSNESNSGSADIRAESETSEGSTLENASDDARLKDLLSLVKDNTLFTHKLENPAYFALIKRVVDRSYEDLKARARENPRFNDFYKKPADHRGELVKLTIHIRRVIPVDINVENEAGVTKLYELWGWTDEAKAWMYCCITPDLPAGFPQEGDVNELVELAGYFFKMQAYQPGDAAPNARNLVAPLVIGRIVSTAPQEKLAQPGLGSWPTYLILGFGVLIMIRLMMNVRLFSRPAPTHRNYRRRPLDPIDTDALGDGLGNQDRGIRIRNADE